MKMHRFKLTGNRAEASEKNHGHHVINDRYVFKDGIMEVPAKGGKHRKALLVDFYACECETFDTEDAETKVEDDGDEDE